VNAALAEVQQPIPGPEEAVVGQRGRTKRCKTCTDMADTRRRRMSLTKVIVSNNFVNQNCLFVILGPHLRTPNSGFNRGFS
jgi:hypothetical protein